MKVIFLDFDGVLVNRNSLLARRVRSPFGLDHKADATCVEQLNRVIEATGAKIVVSSAWRLTFEITQLRELLNWWGVKGEVIGKTPNIIEGWARRGDEIEAWLVLHPGEEVDAFVIIDDNDDMGKSLMPYLVQTDFGAGLTAADADKVIAMLEVKSEDHSLVR